MSLDQELICLQCGGRFVFDLEQQRFYEEKGFVNKPKRCAVCRGAQRALEGVERPKRAMYAAVCAQCGGEALLPFQPRGDKPVYCAVCLLKQKSKRE